MEERGPRDLPLEQSSWLLGTVVRISPRLGVRMAAGAVARVAAAQGDVAVVPE